MLSKGQRIFLRYNNGVVCGLQGLRKIMNTKCLQCILPTCRENNGNKQGTWSMSS